MFLIEIEEALVHGKEKNTVLLEEPFVVRVRVRNVSERKMQLSSVLQTQKHPMVISCGAVQRSLGSMDVGETKELSIEYVSLAPGVQRIGAMVLSDSLSGYARDVGHLLDVFVT
ncbi:hypothetical protein EV177_008242 [Coemansia sp. RSA 1804]|nr:hypothetical protein EV177_008242 [Coemansia sp. RSA 1804]